MTWRDIGAILSGFALGILLGLFLEWRGCGQNGQPGADTVTVHDTVSLPPATLVPNPVQMVIVADPEAEKRADSLIHVIVNKDSLIRVLLMPREAVQAFETASPEGIRVTGHVFARVMPLSGDMLTRVELDPIEIPVKVIYHTEIVTETSISWPWVAGGVAAGVITGVLISK